MQPNLFANYSSHQDQSISQFLFDFIFQFCCNCSASSHRCQFVGVKVPRLVISVWSYLSGHTTLSGKGKTFVQISQHSEPHSIGSFGPFTSYKKPYNPSNSYTPIPTSCSALQLRNQHPGVQLGCLPLTLNLIKTTDKPTPEPQLNQLPNPS